MTRFARPEGSITCGPHGWRNLPDCQSMSLICNHNLTESSFSALECLEYCPKHGNIMRVIGWIIELIKVEERPEKHRMPKHHYPSTSNYFCERGFTLVGHSVATCLNDASMSAPLPRCIINIYTSRSLIIRIRRFFDPLIFQRQI